MRNNFPKSIQPEKTNFKKLPQLTQLNWEQLNTVVGGRLVTPQPGIYMVDDTGDPGDP